MTQDQINQLFSFLYQGQVGEFAFWLRLVSGVVSAALFGAIAVVVFKFWELGKSVREKAEARRTETVVLPPKELVTGPWAEVMQKIESENPSDWNLAVIHADSLIDNLLSEMGMVGQTMGDRLKQLDRSKLASLDYVWEAHKLRNRVAHATDRVLTHEEARRAIEFFSKALKELEYLEE